MGETIKQTVSEWADITIQIWIEKMEQLGINNVFYHAESFKHFIHTAAGGDVLKIVFAFDYFLKFTDMGVGKIYWGKTREGGRVVTLGNRNSIQTTRRQKPWYNKTFLREVRILSEILAKQYAHLTSVTIVENINDNALAWEKQHIKVK